MKKIDFKKEKRKLKIEMGKSNQEKITPDKLLKPADILFFAECFLEKAEQAYKHKDKKYFDFHSQLYLVSMNHYSKMISV